MTITLPGDAMYAVTAQVVLRTERGYSSRQVPTFYLDPTTQGLISPEHAARVALSVLTTMLPYGDHGIDSIHLAVAGPRGQAVLAKSFEAVRA